jgi:hypothetical protein
MVSLGPLPPESEADVALLEKYDKLYRSILAPITDQEARLLVRLFGHDGCFGLASSIMHLIESAPGWPLTDCLTDPSNEWIVEMKNRCIRGGRWPSS